jgi:hypothetical protein
MIYSAAILFITNHKKEFIHLELLISPLITGAGLTYQLLNKTYHVIKLSANAVYETGSFNGNTYNYSKYNGSNKINLWRGSLFAGGWNYLFDKRLRFYYDAYWQPSFNDKNNYRTQFDMGIDFPVWKGLNFTALYTFTHEHVVIANIKQEDKILTFGLTYNLKVKHR